MTILTFVAYLGSVVSCIWAVIEFILYLVKDTVFNWWSVWSILMFGFVALVLGLTTLVFSAKERNKSIKEFGTKKSSFQTRLEQMAEQRKNVSK